MKLPRLVKGKPIPAATGNAIAEGAERARLVVGSGARIQAVQFPGGTSLREAGARPAGIAVVTTAITAGSTTTAGSGVVTLKFFRPGSSYIDTGVSRTIYNSHAKTVAVGDIVQWKVIDGHMFVDVPGNCTDLS
jgi:hypothetical protein